MKLYHSVTSPYVRKVLVVAQMTGQLDALEIVGGAGTPYEPNPDTRAANPLGKIPCLVTDEGQALFDSRVITRFLDARAGGGLYPQAPALWGVLTREALADGMLDAGVLALYEGRMRPEAIQHPPWVEAQKDKIRAGLDRLESEAGAWGEAVDASHVAVGCALGWFDFRFADMAWREGRPALAAWFEGFGARPEMQATRPPEA